MSVIRANLKPTTIERLGRHAKIRLGIGADDLINEALDKLENSNASSRENVTTREKKK